jgi:hypothetical protein
LPERLSELRSLKEPVVEPAGGPEQVRARVQVPVAVLAPVVLLVEPVVLLVVPVLLELPVLLAVQVPVAVHRLAPQPASRDRADKAASPTPHVDG